MIFSDMKSTISLAALASMCSFGAVMQAEARPHHRGDRAAHVVMATGAALHGAAHVVRVVTGTPTVVAQPVVQTVVSPAPVVVQTPAPAVVQTPAPAPVVVQAPAAVA
ncbi:MAG: hypothetical protein SPL08_01940, partial [Pseudomonadota bacterium]|nr:hypothetical protein [Pseudomonadota bacterium]